MKKVVLAAAIVCVAAVSNAAAIAWQVTGIQGSPDVATAALAGSVAYFMDGSDYAAFSALSGDKVAAFAQDNALYTANLTAGRGGALVTATSGNYSAGETVSGFIVIFDNADATAAKNFVATGVDTKTVPGSGTFPLRRSMVPILALGSPPLYRSRPLVSSSSSALPASLSSVSAPNRLGVSS